MSLATRCTSCGTVFRVVQDQLKVSEGWVRCGRCDEVFNALEGLFDLGRDNADFEKTLASATDRPATAPELRPADEADARHADVDPAANATAGDDVDDDPPLQPPLRDLEAASRSEVSARDASMADPIDAHIFRNRRAESDAAKAQLAARDRIEFSDARFDSDLFEESSDTGDGDPGESTATGSADLPLESAHGQPDFIRRAERRARWRRGPVRAALVAGCAVGAIVFVLQVGHHFRDTVAARWPSTRPLLAAWCQAAGCSIEAPQRIHELAIDSHDLTRAVGRDAFILSVTVRSRSELPLKAPWIDLGLTDSNGRLLVRRALAPRDFSIGPIIAPGAETPLQVMLDAKGARVTGYTVDIFYP